MKTRISFALMLAGSLMLVGAALTMTAQGGTGSNGAPPRPKGPCDVYAAAGGSLRGRPQHDTRALRQLQRPSLPGAAAVRWQGAGHRRRRAFRV